MGSTRSQILWRVQLPLALPEILLGINQTILLALSMLVITALVGTRDLGQEVYIALTKADSGRGIVAGLAIAFIGIAADRLMSAWAGNLRHRLGLGAAASSPSILLEKRRIHVLDKIAHRFRLKRSGSKSPIQSIPTLRD